MIYQSARNIPIKAKRWHKSCLFIVLLLIPVLTCSQNNKEKQAKKDTIRISSSGEAHGSLPSSIIDSLSINQSLRNILTDYYHQGYLEARIDRLYTDSTGTSALLNKGNIRYWGELNFKNMHEKVRKEAGFDIQKFENKPIHFDTFISQLKQIIRYYENHGYPFASVSLKDAVWDQNKLNATLGIQKGPLYRIDSLVVVSKKEVPVSYLKNYLGIEKGLIYDEESIKKIPKKINQTGFLNSVRPVEKEFTKKYVHLYTYIKNTQANRFNGIVGILPPEETNSKTRIVGEVNLHLINSFNTGETLDLEWEKTQSLSQKLYTKADFPYLFNSSYGADGTFELYRKDTSYLNLHAELSGKYYYSGKNSFRVFVRSSSSRLVSSDSSYQSNKNEYQNTNLLSAGIGFHYNELDYPLNPASGWLTDISLSSGQKKIRNKSQRITQIEGKVKIEGYLPLYQRWVIKLAGQSKFLISDQLYENELYQIGGTNLLRGFNENSILASKYGVFTCEVRFRLNRESNIFAFWDGAYYEKKTTTDFIEDFPFGFGTGFRFQTNSGLFSISYALGKQFNNPIQFQSGKIHIGYQNVF